VTTTQVLATYNASSSITIKKLKSNFMDDLRRYIKAKGIDAEIIDLAVPMTTAEAAAEQLNISVGGIFKSLVLTKPDKKAIVVVMPGDLRLDQKKLTKLVECKKLKFASSDIVLRETGYPAGGTPPIGHRNELQVYLDIKAMNYESAMEVEADMNCS
jgi:Cys-tRNA(Pro)/Cys-tRNA(Cys) deacylase